MLDSLIFVQVISKNIYMNLFSQLTKPTNGIATNPKRLLNSKSLRTSQGLNNSQKTNSTNGNL